MNRRKVLQTLGLLPAVLATRSALASDVDFSGPLTWRKYEEAMKLAATDNKMICLVVFAQWCPHCKELGPMFKDAEVVKAAKNLHLVNQDSELRPAWLLQRYSRLGAYIPRIHFLRPDGSVVEEITSGNPKFPYFYQGADVAALRTSFQRALLQMNPNSHAAPHAPAPHKTKG